MASFGVKWTSPGKWRTCTVAEVSVAVTAAIVAGGLLWTAAVNAVRYAGALIAGLAGFGAVLAASWAWTTQWGRTGSAHTVHLHHWALVPPLLPCAAGAGHLSLLLQGALVGVMVDAAACWGLDPVVVPLRPPLATSDASTVRRDGGRGGTALVRVA
jgi:hypothetical protein